MAYGATGCGKTYSIFNFENHGIFHRFINQFYQQVDEQINVKFSVKLSLIEIYNETIIDLLNRSNRSNHDIREDPIQGMIISGGKQIEINSKS